MLDATMRLGRAVGAMTAITLVALTMGLLSAVPASADHSMPTPTLNGGWAPFNRCPVDNPTMLSAAGENTIALCVAVNSPGQIKVGGMPLLTTEDSNIQFGALVESNNGPGLIEVKVIPPAGGITVTTPGAVPGGLQSLICPASSWLTRDLCRDHRRPHDRLNEVRGELVNAAAPAVADLLAAFALEQPIIALSYTLRLSNPVLGWHCEIGSPSAPIMVHDENLTIPTGLIVKSFDAEGDPVEENGAFSSFELPGATAGDTQLPIPVAHGCGPGGIFDNAIDAKLKLPSPAGQNSLVLSSVTSFLGGLSNPESQSLSDGEQLSQDWHSAVLPPEHQHGWHH